MIATPLPPVTAVPQTGHYCPVCLRRVRPSQAHRRQHREPIHSGNLEVSLLCCPTCGLTLAADGAAWVQGGALVGVGEAHEIG